MASIIQKDKKRYKRWTRLARESGISVKDISKLEDWAAYKCPEDKIYVP